jgi:hypothetical protein
MLPVSELKLTPAFCLEGRNRCLKNSLGQAILLWVVKSFGATL